MNKNKEEVSSSSNTNLFRSMTMNNIRKIYKPIRDKYDIKKSNNKIVTYDKNRTTFVNKYWKPKPPTQKQIEIARIYEDKIPHYNFSNIGETIGIVNDLENNNKDFVKVYINPKYLFLIVIWNYIYILFS